MLPIKLEFTFAEFLESNDSSTSSRNAVFISYNPISDEDLASTLPKNQKYLVQQWRISGKGDLSPIVNLVLMAQRMSWIMGTMNVIFFNGNDELFRFVEEDLTKTIQVIDPGSRFIPVFCTSLRQIEEYVQGLLVIPYLPSDGLDSLHHYISPDTHYELLSKRGLALSGLPTAKSEVLDFERPEEGWDDSSLNTQIQRTRDAVLSMSAPFVLKTNSSGGGKGVFIVQTESEQRRLKEDICSWQRSELLKLSMENSHLHPCSLILTEWLSGPTLSVNFYIKHNGGAKFVCCCEQSLSRSGHYLGGAITYSLQADQSSRFNELVRKTATFLHSRGYHGPAGIDVMEEKTGDLRIVDLNPRPTASFVLGCLRPHFVRKLNMDEACVLPYMEFLATRSEFSAWFEDELRAGIIIVLAWWTNPASSHSWTSLAVGGKDRFLMNAICDRIRKCAIQVKQ